jgi:hypothetical protein
LWGRRSSFSAPVNDAALAQQENEQEEGDRIAAENGPVRFHRAASSGKAGGRRIPDGGKSDIGLREIPCFI